jgi:hypothetical protein
MSADKIIFDGEWIQVKEKDNWYQYTSMKKSNSQAVMVLVYDLSNPSDQKLLARWENTPCHSPENSFCNTKLPHLYLTSITGQVDKKDKSPSDIALMELEEEAGIIGELDDLEFLGTCYPSKASDTLMYLYAYNGCGKDLGDIKGDGTRGERDAFVEWMSSYKYINNTNCPMVGLAFSRLLNKKILEGFFNDVL